MAEAPKTLPPGSSPGPGRKPSPETVEIRKKIIEMTRKKPGITSPEIAERLEIGTLSLAQIANRLVKTGEIKMVKLRSGVRTYYLPDAEVKPEPEPKTESKAGAEELM